MDNNNIIIDFDYVHVDERNQTLKILMKYTYLKFGKLEEFIWKDEKEPLSDDNFYNLQMSSSEELYICLSNIVHYIFELETILKPFDEYIAEISFLNVLNNSFLIDKALAYTIQFMLENKPITNEDKYKLIALNYLNDVMKSLCLAIDNQTEIVKKKTEQQTHTNEVIEENRICTDGLYVGQMVKNYKELCKILHQEIKAGNSKNSQMLEFKRFFNFDRVGNKFLITEIYDEPLDKVDNRSKGNNSIYIPYIELLLLNFLSTQNDKAVYMSKLDWWKLLGMVNNNYNWNDKILIENHEQNVKNCEIRNFYTCSSKRLDSILKSALTNLKNRKLIVWKYIKIIHYENKDGIIKYKIANDEEEKIILGVERHVLKDIFGCEKMFQIFARWKQKEFYNTVKSILYDKYRWISYQTKINIIYVSKHIKKALEEENEMFQKMELNHRISKSIYDTMKNNVNKYNDKVKDHINNPFGQMKQISELEHNLYRNEGRYLKIQEILIDKLINISSFKNIICNQNGESEYLVMNSYLE